MVVYNGLHHRYHGIMKEANGKIHTSHLAISYKHLYDIIVLILYLSLVHAITVMRRVTR